MAFNSWDKLSKAQRDLPKAKFAVAAVEKHLKKAPKNPYLLAWRADLFLQQNADPKKISHFLESFNALPTLTDPELLSYLYRLGIETKRRNQPEVPIFNSVGDEAIQLWKKAAQSIPNKNGRLELWDRLFGIAMRGECWDDVCTAIVQYSKDDLASRKITHYSRILGFQLAATQNQALETSGQQVTIQFRLARSMLKQAYELSPDDPRAVKDIRDLRFMADIFGRQGQFQELFKLWDDPPSARRMLMKRHHEDLMSIKTRILRDQGAWSLLEKHCLEYIKETLSELESCQKHKSLRELCAWRFDLWQSLLLAITRQYNKEEGARRISTIMSDWFGSEFQAKDRSLRLTYLKMRLFERGSTLSDCKEFWEHHSELPTCFADLLIHVEALPLEDQKAFSKFIQARNRDVSADAGTTLDTYEKWQNVELNVLKFDYLMTISKPPWDLPSVPAMEAFIQKSIGVCITAPREPTAGYLAIYALLRIHKHNLGILEGFNLPGFTAQNNSRLLLQATMLARHLSACEQYKDDRTLSLFAARLHLNLGLGTCAFRLYKNAKCKEMLLDTLSPYILSRISMTHPFDYPGSEEFSADKELAKVVESIERMENKTGSYLHNDIPSFVWDQALEVISLKRKLKSSLTKHICMTERRRMARLKGETAEDIPRLDYRTFHNIEDNIDRTVFPSYERLDSIETINLMMLNQFPNVKYLVELHGPREETTRILYKEPPYPTMDPWCIPGKVITESEDTTFATRTLPEEFLVPAWSGIQLITRCSLHYQDGGLTSAACLKTWKVLYGFLQQLRKSVEQNRLPSSTTHQPQDEVSLFHETKLIFVYTMLELVRAMIRFCDLLRERVTGKTKHPFKDWLTPAMITEFAKETEICYVCVRDLVQSFIDLLASRGVRAIRAQVEWGTTGAALMTFLSEEDVQHYAQEWVSSAVDAWSAVLKVKLR